MHACKLVQRKPTASANNCYQRSSMRQKFRSFLQHVFRRMSCSWIQLVLSDSLVSLRRCLWSANYLWIDCIPGWQATRQGKANPGTRILRRKSLFSNARLNKLSDARWKFIGREYRSHHQQQARRFEHPTRVVPTKATLHASEVQNSQKMLLQYKHDKRLTKLSQDISSYSISMIHIGCRSSTS